DGERHVGERREPGPLAPLARLEGDADAVDLDDRAPLGLRGRRRRPGHGGQRHGGVRRTPAARLRRALGLRGPPPARGLHGRLTPRAAHEPSTASMAAASGEVSYTSANPRSSATWASGGTPRL